MLGQVEYVSVVQHSRLYGGPRRTAYILLEDGTSVWFPGRTTWEAGDTVRFHILPRPGSSNWCVEHTRRTR